MKSADEMAGSVLARRDAYVAAKRKTKKHLAAVSCVALCAVIGIRQAGLCVESIQLASDEAASGSPYRFEDNESAVWEQSYVYAVDTGPYSAYVMGKVIPEAQIRRKLADVTLTAGWQDPADGAWLTRESLRGELYAIADVDGEVAVALKFLDKGEGVTTTHYYVMLNPKADLSAVEEYRIPPAEESHFRP